MVYGDGWCMYLIIHMNIIGKATSNTHYEIHLLLTNDKQQDDDILSYKQKTHLYKCNIYVMHDIWEGYI